MSCRVVIVAEADEQLAAADRWWRENRSELSNLLLNEFEATVRLISEVPGIGPRFRRASLPGIRRVLLSRSNYWVYYFHDKARSVVYSLAVWSTRRGTDPPLAIR